MISRFLSGLGFLTLVTACSGDNNVAPPAPPSGNAAPVFTSSATASTIEDVSGTIYSAAANDSDGDPLTFLISGGAAASVFSITNTGALSFIQPPNFERPRDAGRDNVYDVTLAVSDASVSDSLSLSVTVTQGPEPYRLARVATGLAAPLYLTGRPGAADVFVTERNGVIRLLNPATGVVAATPFLDISASVGTTGEGGLLGFVVAPDYTTSGTFYVHVTNLALPALNH